MPPRKSIEITLTSSGTTGSIFSITHVLESVAMVKCQDNLDKSTREDYFLGGVASSQYQSLVH